jgi:signal peptidase II
VRSRASGFILAAGWLALDQLTKMWASSRLVAPVTIVPGLFRLTLSHNRGGLFGWLDGAPDPWRKILLTGLPILAVVAITVMLARVAARERIARLALALILGGAAGNLLDRLISGHVVDFLDIFSDWRPAAAVLEFFFRVNHWPTFNVADLGLTVGAILLVLQIARRRPAVEDAVSASLPR